MANLVIHALGKPGCLQSLQTLGVVEDYIGGEGFAALAVDTVGKPGCLPSLQCLGLNYANIGTGSFGASAPLAPPSPLGRL
jgi:hypothetical protein